jgi:transcription antitermination factor NusG
VRRWRPACTLDLPLFPGYVFVHLALRPLAGIADAEMSSGWWIGGQPSPLEDREIDALRARIFSRYAHQPHRI